MIITGSVGIVKFFCISYKACSKVNLLPAYIIQMPYSFTSQKLEKLNLFQMWFSIILYKI